MILSFYCSFIVVLVLLLLFIFTIFLNINVSEVYTREESSSYECGFEHHSLSRVPLSIRYFTLTIIFLVFDIEIVLLLLTPLTILSGVSLSVLLVLIVFFIIILFLGLVYE